MRILLVALSRLWPPTTGGRQRSLHLLRSLAECGEVDVVAAHPLDRSGELQRLVARLHTIPQATSPPRLIPGREPLGSRLARRWNSLRAPYQINSLTWQYVQEVVRAGSFDVAVGRYASAAVQSGVLHLTPAVIDLDDLVSDSALSRSKSPAVPAWKRPAYGATGLRNRRIERKLFAHAAGLWVSSAHNLLTVGLNNARVLPNIPFHPPAHPSPSPNTTTVLAVAALSYGPNARGVDWFVEHVWPEVRRSVRDAKLRLVGGGMDPHHRERWSNTAGVEAVGFVEDLTAEYERCAFTVAPVFEGAGTKIKVLESLANRRTCVVTEHIYQGFKDFLRNEHALLVADKRGFAQACITLLRSQELRRQLESHGLEVVNRHYSYERFLATVSSTLADVVASHPEGLRVGPQATGGQT